MPWLDMSKETPVALELASLLLRFSNEQRAADWGGERGRLVQNGRYSKEAAILSKVPPLDGGGRERPENVTKKMFGEFKNWKKTNKIIPGHQSASTKYEQSSWSADSQ